jgi:hypothetical protein
MPEETVITGMPRHVVEAAENARRAEAAAAAGLNVRPPSQAPAAMPNEAAETAATTGEQQPPAGQADTGTPAPDVAVATDDASTTQETPEQSKAKIAELEALVKDQRDRLRRHHGQQRAAREGIEKEVSNLKAEIARLQAQAEKAPSVDTDDAVLVRNGYTQDEVNELTSSEKLIAARAMRKSEETTRGFATEREQLQQAMASRTGQDRLNAADSAIDTARPGFLAAIKQGSDVEADWSLFSSEVNPDSATGLTWKETLDHARKVGDKATVLKVADLFAKDAGLAFKADAAPASSDSTAAVRVEVPQRRVMPSSGPAAPTGDQAPSADTTASKRTYPRSYAEKFYSVAATRQGVTFAPFTISAGGTSKTFQTIKEMEREREALLDAGDDGRITRG